MSSSSNTIKQCSFHFASPFSHNLSFSKMEKANNFDKLKRLRGWVQDYDWGICGNEAQVARILTLNSGVQINPDKPYAEFWMGTHESRPAYLADDNGEDEILSLKEWILKNPNVLGQKILKKWDLDLLFLFKYMMKQRMSWVCDESKQQHQKVPEDLLEEAKVAARTALEKMDAD